METQNTPVQEKKLSKSVIGALILIVILIILFFVLQPSNEVNAPAMDDTTEATSTDDMMTGSTTDSVEQSSESMIGQVIEGDGFVGVVTGVKEIKKEIPEIVKFEARATAGNNCVFSWEVKKAERCNFRIAQEGTQIPGVQTTGSLQIGAGQYYLYCVGAGGGTASSETLTCPVQ